jgi:hypothetical protein
MIFYFEKSGHKKPEGPRKLIPGPSSYILNGFPVRLYFHCGSIRMPPPKTGGFNDTGFAVRLYHDTNVDIISTVKNGRAKKFKKSASGSGLQSSGFQLSMSVFRLRSSVPGLRSSDFHLPSPVFQLPTIINFQLSTFNFGLPSFNFRLRASDFRLQASVFLLTSSRNLPEFRPIPMFPISGFPFPRYCF